MKKLLSRNRASALLLSFFLMSILVLVAMAVSVLVIHDIRASRTMVSGAQSLYAAEGVTELGMQAMKDNLPGYETDLTGYELANTALASLDTTARSDTDTVPCKGQGNDEGWRTLTQNESVQIPLFAQTDAAGKVEDVEKFYVEFYTANAEGVSNFPSNLDVLRWKILGLKKNTDGSVTDTTQALSEYIPLYPDSSGLSFFASDPTIVGASVPTNYLYGKFYDEGIIHTYYPIGDFLTGHSYNYLVLTNVVTDSDDNVIYFRFHTSGTQGVCEYASLAATGSSGDTQQELNTLVKEGENLPVFDFVLYHTGDSGSETSP